MKIKLTDSEKEFMSTLSRYIKDFPEAEDFDMNADLSAVSIAKRLERKGLLENVEKHGDRDTANNICGLYIEITPSGLETLRDLSANQ